MAISLDPPSGPYSISCWVAQLVPRNSLKSCPASGTMDAENACILRSHPPPPATADPLGGKASDKGQEKRGLKRSCCGRAPVGPELALGFRLLQGTRRQIA